MKQEIAVTVDSVIFKKAEGTTKLLLIKRKNDPFKNSWALPGGFLEEDESLENGAKRELKEETGIEIESLKQFNTYGDIQRDPRGRTISIAFIGILTKESQIVAGDDAAEAKWFYLEELPNLAFDHFQIIQDANSWLKKNKY